MNWFDDDNDNNHDDDDDNNNSNNMIIMGTCITHIFPLRVLKALFTKQHQRHLTNELQINVLITHSKGHDEG